MSASVGQSKFLIDVITGVADISDNARKRIGPSQADPADIDFVGLEPDLSDNVHST